MIAGPPQQSATHDTLDRENSLLLKKIQSGKMETSKNTATPGSPGYVIPEDVVDEFCAGFLDEKTCRMWILEKLQPRGAYCPKCGRELTGRYKTRYFEAVRIRCPHCSKQFTALTGTMLHGVHMDFREIILLALLLGMDQPARTIADFLGGHKETIRIWRQRFKQTRTLMNR